MIMTWTQLAWCIAAFALLWNFASMSSRIKTLGGVVYDLKDRLLALEERLHDQCNMDEAMQRVEQFQHATAEIMRGGGVVHDCRRCGANPIDGETSQTIYDGDTGCYRMVCECHPRATSNWGETAADVLTSWNVHQEPAVSDFRHTRDIYEMFAAEHPAIPLCACCQEDCWLIKFGDARMSTFHIENGCNEHQESNGWHKTTEAAYNAWEKQQAEISRIEEIAAEENR